MFIVCNINNFHFHLNLFYLLCVPFHFDIVCIISHLQNKVGQVQLAKPRKETSWQFEETIFKLVERVVYKLHQSCLEGWQNIDEDFLLGVIEDVPHNTDGPARLHLDRICVNLLKSVVQEVKMFTLHHKSLLVVEFEETLFHEHRSHFGVDEIFLGSTEVAAG